MMRAVVGAERDRLVAEQVDGAAESLSPEEREEREREEREREERVRQNPLLGILWVAAGTSREISAPDQETEREDDDVSDDEPLLAQLEGDTGWRASSSGARFTPASQIPTGRRDRGYRDLRCEACRQMESFTSGHPTVRHTCLRSDSSARGYTERKTSIRCSVCGQGPSRWHPATCTGTFIDTRDKNSTDKQRAAAKAARGQMKCSVCGQGPSRWHPATCTGSFIDAMKYDTARAFSPVAAETERKRSREKILADQARARAERAARSREGLGSSRGSIDTREPEIDRPQQQGCAKCGKPLGSKDETTWARHGPRVGLHYHKRCREIPWPDPAQVSVYTGIPEGSAVRKQVKARVSKCDVCGQGPSRWHAAQCNGRFVTQVRDDDGAD